MQGADANIAIDVGDRGKCACANNEFAEFAAWLNGRIVRSKKILDAIRERPEVAIMKLTNWSGVPLSIWWHWMLVSAARENTIAMKLKVKLLTLRERLYDHGVLIANAHLGE